MENNNNNNFYHTPLRNHSPDFPPRKPLKPNKLKFQLPKFEIPKDPKQLLFWIAAGIIGLCLGGFLLFSLLIFIIGWGLPDVHDLDKLSVAQSTTIYDREGNVIYTKFGEENRQYVTYDQISENIINATVAIEDDGYWNHGGFDAFGIIRAIINNVLGGPRQGGSTITQQYIKYAFLSPEQTYTRKIKELILAVRLEETFDKKKILELYLNKIPYGNNAFGVEKASQIYFGKKAKDLNIAEASIIAAITQAPSRYNPYGPKKYTELTKEFTPEELSHRNIQTEADLDEHTEFARGLIGKVHKIGNRNVYLQGRTDLVLRAMEKNGYITNEQREDALKTLQNLQFKEQKEDIPHAHFIMDVIDQLEEKYGKEVVAQGGLKVYTTLDPRLQDAAEKAIVEGVEANTKKYNAKNGALLALDPKTGEVLALVGSADYFGKEIEGSLDITTQAYRQPGSTFKPFVYAQAFNNRFSPGSVVYDTQTRFGSNAFPKNYDGKFRGPMTMRSALAQSRNIPAIKAYFLAGEQGPIKELIKKMGVKFKNEKEENLDYGYPMALGSPRVRLIDMVTAYGVFANGGTRHDPVFITKVVNSSGEVLEEWKPTPGEAALDPQVAYLITSILSDTSVRLSETMTIPGQINAAKTGTSDRQLDNGKYVPNDLWAISYTTRLVAGVWNGNNRESDLLAAGADGSSSAAPILKKFMTEALKDSPAEQFPVPEGIKTVQISKLTGKLPGPATPPDQIVSEIFASFAVPTEIDDSYTVATIDTRNNKLANEYCPPEFVAQRSYLNVVDIAPYPEWQKGVDEWLKNSSNSSGETQETETNSSMSGAAPTEFSELCTVDRSDGKPIVEITDPGENDNFDAGTKVETIAKINSKNGVAKVEFYLDGRFQDSITSSPYVGSIRLPLGEIGIKKHIITVKAIDQYGYSSEANVNISTSGSKPSTPKEPLTTETTTTETSSENP